jgi:Tfp pilus assembly protein PilX
MARSPLQRNLRCGTILAAALICLLVVSVLGASLLRRTILEHRQSLQRERQGQAFWLAESGLQRARAALTASHSYAGETWQVPSDQLADRDAGTITIEVQTDEASPNQRRILVTAAWGDDQIHRVTFRRQIQIKMPDQGADT